MPLFNKKKRAMSSQQKANKAQMRILARALGCGWLGYIIIQMVRTPTAESGMSSAMRMSAIVVFTIGAVILGALTIIEIVNNIRAGYYTASYYKDDPDFGREVSEPEEGGEDASSEGLEIELKDPDDESEDLENPEE